MLARARQEALAKREAELQRQHIAQLERQVAEQERRGLALGIYRRGSHQVEPIRDCRIQHKALTAFGQLAGDVLRHHEVPAYDEQTGEGVPMRP